MKEKLKVLKNLFENKLMPQSEVENKATEPANQLSLGEYLGIRAQELDAKVAGLSNQLISLDPWDRESIPRLVAELEEATAAAMVVAHARAQLPRAFRSKLENEEAARVQRGVDEQMKMSAARRVAELRAKKAVNSWGRLSGDPHEETATYNKTFNQELIKLNQLTLPEITNLLHKESPKTEMVIETGGW